MRYNSNHLVKSEPSKIKPFQSYEADFNSLLQEFWTAKNIYQRNRRGTRPTHLFCSDEVWRSFVRSSRDFGIQNANPNYNKNGRPIVMAHGMYIVGSPDLESKVFLLTNDNL